MEPNISKLDTSLILIPYMFKENSYSHCILYSEQQSGNGWWKGYVVRKGRNHYEGKLCKPSSQLRAIGRSRVFAHMQPRRGLAGLWSLTFKEYQKAQAADPECSVVMNYAGKYGLVPTRDSNTLWNYRGKFTVSSNGPLLYDSRIVVP